GDDHLFRATLGQPLGRGIRQHTVGGRNDYVPRAVVPEELHRSRDGAASVDHVVGQHAGPAADITDDTVRHHLVWDPRVAGLVNEGQRHATQCVRPLLGDTHPAGVGGDHHDVVGRVVVLDVAGQQVLGAHVVDGPVEEALNLVGVQVDGDYPVCARRLQ